MGLQWIVFEAGDGVGKSTQVQLLNEYYQEKHSIEPHVCRQPGNTKLGNILRTILLSDEYTEHLCIEAERLLFAADNAQFIEEIIIPALQDKQVIIQDRYTPYSNFAYGVHGSGVSRDFMKLLEIATQGYYPDVVFLLDLDPKVAQERMHARGEIERTRIDKFNLDFHSRVRNGYLELADEDPQRFRVIDASKSAELIHNEIIEEIVKMQ